jgi:hypothetical protein
MTARNERRERFVSFSEENGNKNLIFNVRVTPWRYQFNNHLRFPCLLTFQFYDLICRSFSHYYRHFYLPPRLTNVFSCENYKPWNEKGKYRVWWIAGNFEESRNDFFQICSEQEYWAFCVAVKKETGQFYYLRQNPKRLAHLVYFNVNTNMA